MNSNKHLDTDSNSTAGENSSPTSGEKATLCKKPFGMLSTWNQECGLATYAQYMLSVFDEGTYCVFAEEASDARLGEDQAWVSRCWNRTSADYTKLEAAIQNADIGLLYLNVHARFFSYPNFSSFAARVRAKGVKIVAHLHSVYTLDESVVELGKCVDEVVVHTPENRLEAIANGIAPEKVSVVAHGVCKKEAITETEKLDLRKQLSLPTDGQIVSCFGFVQPHKGMECLIESISELRKSNYPVYGVVAGSAHAPDPNSVRYLENLKQLSKQLGVDRYIHFVDRFISNEEVTQYLQAADVVLMNYQSQHYEASGACSLAVGAGAVVASSIAPPFAAFGDAVWHISSGFPAALSIGALLSNQQLRSDIQRNALQYSEENSWEQTRSKIEKIFNKLAFEQTEMRKESVVTHSNNAEHGSGQSIRVLIQSRPNSFTQRGGDTVVMEKMAARLQDRGVHVTIDVENTKNPKDYDIVHLFNFALPELLRQQAERAVAANVPFVVTTLNEDISNFHNQSAAMSQFLVEYVKRGQDRVWYAEHRKSYLQVEGCASFDNSWVVRQAAALLTNGENESETLRRDYGNISNIQVIRLGCDLGVAGNPALFTNEFGVKDYVLCVGRIESRKNQLMLLKALENEDIPVVIAGGGFTYQPAYAQAAQSFQRRGQTIITGRLSDEMLASAYAGAKVHALPSWYELPGLVSLEAASYGSNVVATEMGTARDYLGDKAFYCDPNNEDSIRNAVLAAYYGPKQEGLDAVVRGYTWEKVAEETYQLYRRICPQGTSAIAPAVHPQSSMQVPEINIQLPNSQPQVASASNEDFQQWLMKGEEAAQEKEFSTAHQALQKAEDIDSTSARVFRARAAVFMAEGNQADAQRYFEKAYAIDSNDPKTLSGLGMCQMMQDNPEGAYPHFVKALEKDHSQLVGILQLIECAYRLERFDDLERVLERYVQQNPEDIEMEFCYAGCLYKLGRFAKSRELANHVQSVSPNHLGAKELLEVLDKNSATADSSLAASTQGQEAQEAIAPAKPVSSPVLGSLVERETTASAPQSFGSLDQRIVELEDLKKQRKFEEVLEGCESMLSSPLLSLPQKESVTLLRAESLVFMEKADEAEVIFKQVLCDNPRSARALCGQAALAGSRSEWSTAKELFEEANRQMPDYDVPHAGLGMCAASCGDKEEAWRYYSRALKLNQENTSALLGMIELAYAMGRYGELEEAIQRYLDMHPADLNFLYSLAGCLYAQGKLQEALSEVQKITLFDPQHQHANELKQIIDEKLEGSAISV